MRRVFIHSWHGDFAKTQIASEAESLGRAVRQGKRPLRLIACGCGTAHLQRTHRPMWMRFVPVFRLYACKRCGAHVFGPRGSAQGIPCALSEASTRALHRSA